MICVGVGGIQLDHPLVILDGRFVLAQLSQAVAPVVVEAHSAGALLQGSSVVLAGSTKLAQLAEGVPSVAQGCQIRWGPLQHSASHHTPGVTASQLSVSA